MTTVAAVAGEGLDKNVVKISSTGEAALARNEVSRLLRAPLSADAAVQIALLNNAGLQAAYNRLGVAEAVAVQASRPPLPSFSYDWVKTSIELDIERQVVASILSLATWPARSKLAGVRFEQAEFKAAEETLRLAAETRRAYIRAVAARQIVAALNAARASGQSAAELSQSLTETGAVNKHNGLCTKWRCLPVEAPGLTESWSDATPVQQAEQRLEAPRDRAEGSLSRFASLCEAVSRPDSCAYRG
jgi:hypothetical protein